MPLILGAGWIPCGYGQGWTVSDAQARAAAQTVTGQGTRPAWFYQPDLNDRVRRMDEAELEAALDEVVQAEQDAELDGWVSGSAAGVWVDPEDANVIDPQAEALKVVPFDWTLSGFVSFNYNDNPDNGVVSGSGSGSDSSEAIISAGPDFRLFYGDEESTWRIGLAYRLGYRYVLEGFQDDGFDQAGTLSINYIAGKLSVGSATTASYGLRDNYDSGTRGNQLQVNQRFNLDYQHSPKTSAGGVVSFDLIEPDDSGNRSEAFFSLYSDYKYSPKSSVGLGVDGDFAWFSGSDSPTENDRNMLRGYLRFGYDPQTKWDAMLRLGVDGRRYADDDVEWNPYAAITLNWTISERWWFTVNAGLDYTQDADSSLSLAPDVRVALGYTTPTETQLSLSAYTTPEDSFRNSQSYVVTGVMASVSQRLFASLVADLSGGYEVSKYEARDGSDPRGSYEEDYAFARVSLAHPLGVNSTISAFYQISDRSGGRSGFSDGVSNQVGISIGMRFR